MRNLTLGSTLLSTLVMSFMLIAPLHARADPVRDLVVAAQMDNGSFARKLIEKGLSPNTLDPVSGEPVLLVALREDSHTVVDVLLANPDLNLEMMAPNGNTALMMAAFKGNRRAVAGLLAKGALVTRPGWTALHYAAAGGHADIASMLLDKNAEINGKAPGDLTPLMMAAREGHPKVAELLLRLGADARLKSGENLSASQIATERGHVAIAAMIDRHVRGQNDTK